MGRLCKPKRSAAPAPIRAGKRGPNKGGVRKRGGKCKLPRSTQSEKTPCQHSEAAVTAQPTPTPRGATSGVSANWKSLAEVLGLQTTRKPVKGTKTSGSSSSSTKRQAKRTHNPLFTALGDDAPTTEAVPKAAAVNSRLVTGLDKSAGKCVGMDCEMVGTGPDASFSMLARCSLVNHHGNVLYDSFVAPMDTITDYRTSVSGVTPSDLRGAPTFSSVQKDVSDLIQGRTLVGHALHHDLKALMLSHPRRDIRDTSGYSKFRQLSKGKRPSLKKLAQELLGVDIQQKEHNSVQDARVAMRLYQLHKKEWEKALKRHP